MRVNDTVGPPGLSSILQYFLSWKYYIIYYKKLSIHQGVPVLFILCSRKTIAMYTAVWEFVTRWAPELTNNLRVVVSDFERAILVSTRRMFPRIQLRGCWFHFTRVRNIIIWR